jgi:predicted nuclease of predicted toxin-antitoxin system
VWGGALGELRSLGHDVQAVSDWPEDPGDEAILGRARDLDRVLVTLDKDFGELAVVRGPPHAGIVRLVGVCARKQAAACAAVLGRYGEPLRRGAIVTFERTRIRVRDTS